MTYEGGIAISIGFIGHKNRCEIMWIQIIMLLFVDFLFVYSFLFFLISLTWELCGQMSRCASMRVLWMKLNLKDIIIFAYISYSDLRFRYLAAFTKRREDLSTGWSIQSRDIQQLIRILWTKDVCTMKVRPVLCLLISMCNFFYISDFLFAIHSNRVKSIKALSRLDGAPCMRVFLELCNLF